MGSSGLIKIGDLASDIFFVATLSKNTKYFDNVFAQDGTNLLIAAIFFTAIGILFDLYNAAF